MSTSVPGEMADLLWEVGLVHLFLIGKPRQDLFRKGLPTCPSLWFQSGGCVEAGGSRLGVASAELH